MNETNFPTRGLAADYCRKYVEVFGNTDVFAIAEALLRAYNDGHQFVPDMLKALKWTFSRLESYGNLELLGEFQEEFGDLLAKIKGGE